jgi:hypothetical protein
LNIFLSLLLPWGGEVWRISGSFALSAGSRLARHHLELNLTSNNAPIYHPQRRHEAKSVLGHLFTCPSNKMNFLSNTATTIRVSAEPSGKAEPPMAL